MNLFDNILSLLNNFQVACILFVALLFVALLVKLAVYLYEKHDMTFIPKNVLEIITKSPIYIVYGGIFISVMAIILKLHKMQGEIAIALNNGHLAYALLLATAVIYLIWKIITLLFPKKDRVVTPIHLLFAGIFVAALAYFYPLCREFIAINNDTPNEDYSLAAIWTSVQYSIRVFLLGGDLLWLFNMKDAIGQPISVISDPAVRDFYTRVGSVLYIAAPILTFSFVLTFFKNVIAKIVYALAIFLPTHVFGELNEKSLALAADLKKKNVFNLIIFTDINDKVNKENAELVEDARMLGAILFSKDFDSIKFKGVLPRKLSFYLISEDEHKKLRQAEVVMKKYDHRGVELRLFSPDVRSQLLMDAFSPKRMHAIRIDDIQTLVYHNLYTSGKMLFDRARTVEGEKGKVISAVIVGLGQYGKEMLKALTWFCQLEGYKVKITAFDSDKDAEAKFKYMCPELLHENYNGKLIEGEPYYEIKIVGGIDVTTPKFREELEKITDASYIFVCLGTDAINLRTATEIRSICESVDYGKDAHKPDIETVVYDSKLAKSLRTTWKAIADGATDDKVKEGVTNFKGKPYNILITGDLNSFYSVSTLIDSKLIDAGFRIHYSYSIKDAQKKAEELKIKYKKNRIILSIKLRCLKKKTDRNAARSFWKYEYNHNSSIARAIHRQLRIDMNQYPDINNWDGLTHEAKVVIANPEHIRWNAYMRTKGYSLGKRNDLGKRHHNLVPTIKLSDDDLEKD